MIHFKGYIGVFKLLFIQFVSLLVIYAALRIGFYFSNQSLFPGITFADFFRILEGGVRFDISALLYINSLYIILIAIPLPWKYTQGWKRILMYVFVITNALGIGLNLIDYAYYPFTLKRTTGTILQEFANESNTTQLVFSFMADYWYLVLLFVVLVWGLFKFSKLFTVEKPKFDIRFYLIHFAGLLVVSFLFIGGVRGGWAHSTRPITISNAGDYVKLPEQINIVTNTPFSIFRTLKAIKLEEIHHYSRKELEAIYPLVHYPDSGAAFKDLNVVFLILESFAKEHVGSLNKDIQDGQYKGYTPFLDSLIENGYSFTNSFANGRKSIDALPSVITGIPSVSEPFVLSIYSGNKTASIAHLLKSKGYETAFFHGAPNGSMGFSAYTKLAGIEKYFGKDEYNNNKDFDGIWGIWDEPFMQYMADEITALSEPFFVGFFSLSSHHPFKVPTQYKDVFPKGPLPVQETIGYTDHALKEFFKKSSTMPWFDNTLFVICADHATVSYLPEYKTSVGNYAIPIVFYYPKGGLVGLSDKLVQQIDILPTVLHYLNYDKPFLSFGFDAFNDEIDNFVVNSNGKSFNFFKNNYYMAHDGQRPLSLYNLKKDRFLKSNVLEEENNVAHDLERSLKAFIQQYNNRMIANELVLE